MTTQQTNWTEYTGSDEQIAEISSCKNGIVFKYEGGREIINYQFDESTNFILPLPTHYLICNPHPLADMICKQAKTGQPVWIKQKCNGNLLDYALGTTAPDWNIPNAEYSFTPFEKDIEFKGEV